MPALSTGTAAPGFDLPVMNGEKFSLHAALTHGPVILAFFKVSCPVCQYALPFIERIYQSHGGKDVTIVGISQNGAKDTAAFVKEYGMTFPVLLDDPNAYPVSNAYGLTNVPTVFWIGQDGQIELSSVGWSRKDIEEINRKAAEANRATILPVFEPGESVPEFRAG